VRSQPTARRRGCGSRRGRRAYEHSYSYTCYVYVLYVCHMLQVLIARSARACADFLIIASKGLCGAAHSTSSSNCSLAKPQLSSFVVCGCFPTSMSARTSGWGGVGGGWGAAAARERKVKRTVDHLEPRGCIERRLVNPATHRLRSGGGGSSSSSGSKNGGSSSGSGIGSGSGSGCVTFGPWRLGNAAGEIWRGGGPARGHYICCTRGGGGGGRGLLTNTSCFSPNADACNAASVTSHLARDEP
jgi:hypothetical protein